jgi:catechol 2,3-dioxygenase-like lactoylglutathione lyase family enzyme
MVFGIALDHCVIHVSNWERSNAFYRDVLGAEIVPRGRGYAYRFGPVQLNCHGPGQSGNPVARLPVMPGNSDICFVWPSSVDKARAHLELHGVAIELGPVARAGARGEGTSLYFRDPDGSLLEFICYESPIES